MKNRISLVKGSQDVHFEEHLMVGPHKCRINIRSDSYRTQCHARCYVWNPNDLQWNLVSHIHPNAMKTESEIAYIPSMRQTVDTEAHRKMFKLDRDELANQLAEILL